MPSNDDMINSYRELINCWAPCFCSSLILGQQAISVSSSYSSSFS